MASGSGWMSSPKKRKLQLDSMQCQNLTAEGTASLTNPTQAPNSSTKVSDPNKGLYPRKKKKKTHHKDHNNSSDEESSYSQNSGRSFNSFNNNPIQKNEFNSFQSASSIPLASSNIPQRNPSNSNWSNSPIKQASNFNQTTNSYSPRKSKKPAKSPQKNNLFNYYTKDSDYKPKLPSVTFNPGPKVVANVNVASSLNIGYESSPENSPSRKPEKTSLAVEISNCQNQMDETLEISSDDSAELDNSGFFGVKETKTVEDEPECLFDKIPNEVLEMVFGHLPLTSLLGSASLVCHSWNDVISHEHFLAWKKKYHKLKCYPKACGRTMSDELLNYLKDRKMNTPETLIFGIIKDVAIFEKKNTEAERKANLEMMFYLQKHRKYFSAVEVVRTQFPEISQEDDLNPYAIISAIVTLSENFEDVGNILKLLIHPKSGCNIIDLLECLYYLATIFYYAALHLDVAKGHHYKLYYTLYQYENLWFGTTKDYSSAVKQNNVGQQSITKYGEGKTRLTNQQIRIINHELGPNQVVKIVAFAGTGKTSTLVEYTKKRPGQRFLNIVFNKSVCEQALKIFPLNVECRTAHSLAYRAIDVRNVYKFAIGSMKPKDLEKFDLKGPKHFKGKGPNAIEKDKYRRGVLTTFETYINSADERITIAHAPEHYNEKSRGEKSPIHDEDRLNMVTDAVTIWKRMIDPKDWEVKMMHDGYLKLHQLQKPVYDNYHCILIDEAQDCNPAMLSIILNQKAPKIFVGDPNQQIYAFRGAVNALESIEHTHIYYLTQSFRFGPEIAYVANTILFETKNVRSQTLVGGKTKAYINQKRIGQLAILSRTNSSLFKEAVRLICLKDIKAGEPRDIRGHFNGGTEGLKQLVDIFKLKMISEGQMNRDEVNIKDRFIQKFFSFEGLKMYATAAEDVELNGKINLVEKYNENIPNYVENIVNNCKHNLKTANVVFSSVHKAKGMEFDTVMLTDDFSTLGYPFTGLPVFGRNQLDQEKENELNILYVAATRAKKCLLLNSSLYYMLLGAGERYEYPIHRNDVQSWVCSECNDNIDQTNLKFVLTRNNLTLGNGLEMVKEGSLCGECVLKSDYEEEEEELLFNPEIPIFDEIGLMFVRRTLHINSHKLFLPILGL